MNPSFVDQLHSKGFADVAKGFSDAADIFERELRLPTYPENDLCEFCGIRPWTTLIIEADGTYHACGVCAATCPECGVVYEHTVTCSLLEREPEAADRLLVDWDIWAKDTRL